MKYRCMYTFHKRFGEHREHRWELVGRHLGLHVHITEYEPDSDLARNSTRGCLGGIEIHYRSPPDYMKDYAPSHDECFLLKAPCWHDGSSLQADEEWIPLWLSVRRTPEEHDRMFEAMEARADEISREQVCSIVSVLQQSLTEKETTDEG